MSNTKHGKSGKKSSGAAVPGKDVKPGTKNTVSAASAARVSVDELFLHFTANIIKEDTLFTR